MSTTITVKDFIKKMQRAFQNIRENVGLLSELDAATGDGDHGVTMVRIVDAADKAVESKGTADLKALFMGMGMGAMSAGGGSAGPLMGSFFMGLNQGLPSGDLMDAAAVARLITAGYEGMFRQSKAGIGDRTMMDALKPAVDALNANVQDGDIQKMLTEAANAAVSGAEATSQMLAKFGRARNLGDRVLGHPDPGAVSWSLIFKGLAED